MNWEAIGAVGEIIGALAVSPALDDLIKSYESTILSLSNRQRQNKARTP